MPTFRSSMFCKSSVPNQRGFLLIEIIVGVGLLALLGYMAMEWVTVTARNTARDAAIAETVADYKVLVRAATEYVAEQQGSWSPGSSHTITIATLEAAGKLPAGFATRAYGAGRTVYGAPFRIVSIRNTLEPGSKTVIGDAPSDNQAAFEALGWNYTAAQALATKRAVAAVLAAEGLPVATTPAGSSTAIGGGSNQWTKPLSAWIGTPTWPGLHVLMGWPDLAGSTGGPGEETAFNGTCEINVARNPVCGSGFTEYDRWDACRASGYTVRQTPNGLTLAYGMNTIEAPNTVPCNQTCAREPYFVACQDDIRATTYNEIYLVEGLRIAEVWCRTSYPRNDTPTYPSSCGITESNAYPNYSIALTGVHPKAILCCHEN